MRRASKLWQVRAPKEVEPQESGSSLIKFFIQSHKGKKVLVSGVCGQDNAKMTISELVTMFTKESTDGDPWPAMTAFVDHWATTRMCAMQEAQYAEFAEVSGIAPRAIRRVGLPKRQQTMANVLQMFTPDKSPSRPEEDSSDGNTDESSDDEQGPAGSVEDGHTEQPAAQTVAWEAKPRGKGQGTRDKGHGEGQGTSPGTVGALDNEFPNRAGCDHVQSGGTWNV
ncbi:hypothetical protein CYMTET_40656 [Cymbomonas tetramitiformis]|uniref:Uncharacterized protein n=1 Tax=Cymbomonas tetramitiformis TaxID=36881 RepID=A0AAE0F315_9CHLO|nr:hypothetical protein CYMTET_40656 [Cymbomonas tetramitiformis]